jgi:hypothetical protein
MKNFDINEIDFSPLEKIVSPEEYIRIIAVLQRLYYKHCNIYNRRTHEIDYIASDLSWMCKNTRIKILKRMKEIGLIEDIIKPNKNKTGKIILVSDEDLIKIINKHEIIDLPSYQKGKFSRDILEQFLRCPNITLHFKTKELMDWVRNINNDKWNRNRLMIYSKIAVNFNSSVNIKTGSVMKSMRNTMGFANSVKTLYDRVPINRQEILYLHFKNSLTTKGKKVVGNFEKVVKEYLKFYQLQV